jgi:hypothetical protein
VRSAVHLPVPISPQAIWVVTSTYFGSNSKIESSNRGY